MQNDRHIPQAPPRDDLDFHSGLKELAELAHLLDPLFGPDRHDPNPYPDIIPDPSDPSDPPLHLIYANKSATRCPISDSRDTQNLEHCTLGTLKVEEGDYRAETRTAFHAPAPLGAAREDLIVDYASIEQDTGRALTPFEREHLAREAVRRALEAMGRTAEARKLVPRAWRRMSCAGCGAYFVIPLAENTPLDPGYARRYAVRLIRHYKAKVRATLALPQARLSRHRGYRLKHIVLTMARTDAGLMADLTRLSRARAQIFSARGMLGKAPGSFALAAIEVGPQGGQIHIHALYWGPFIPQAELSREWARITGGNSVVYIREVRGLFGEAVDIEGVLGQVVGYALGECLKGGTRYGDVFDPLAWIGQVDAFRHSHMRRITSYGLIRGVLFSVPRENYVIPCPLCSSPLVDMGLTYTPPEPRGPP